MKFGGTSLGSGGRIEDVVTIVRSRGPRAPLVVASAMAGATNNLLAAAELAALGQGAEAQLIVDALERRHREAADRLGVADRPVVDLAGGGAAWPFVAARLAETRDRLRGVALLGELTDRSKDAIAATGELCSSALLAAALGASWLDVRDVMRTDETYGAAVPRLALVDRLVAEHVVPRLGPGRAVVTQGFVGRTEAGVTTTLGRGGSDYSAAVLGAALGATEIEIWTDVDGMLSADPRVVPAARLLPEVSFGEASELAYFGAKVLHPATIRPALARGIPVRIRNTFRPDGPSTLIRESGSPADETAVRAIACRKGITVVLISNPRMLMSHGWSARAFEVFARHRISIDLIATSEVSISLTVDDAARLAGAVAELSEMAAVSVMPEQAVVAVVGNGMRHRPGVAAAVFGALSTINVAMISMGASDLNLSFVVAESEADDAVRRLHRRFCEEPFGAEAPA